MKKLFLVFAALFLCNCLYAEKLFQYRGIFPADRSSDLVISNYILLKKDTKVSFSFEEQGKGASDRIKITEIKLTSNPKIIFSEQKSLNEIEIVETGIYQVKLEPTSPGGGEIRFVFNVREGYPATKVPSPKVPMVVASQTPVLSPIKKPVEADRIVHDVSKFSLEKVNIGKIETVADIDSSNEKKIASAPITAATDLNAQDKTAVSAIVASGPIASDKPLIVIDLLSPQPGSYLNPFNGFKFECAANGADLKAIASENVKVFQMSANGSSLPVDGQFYSARENQVSFLPNKLESGAIYTVKNLLSDGPATRLAAFPDLRCNSQISDSSIKIKLFWQQINNLLPNPLGQVVKLENSLIQIKSSDKELLRLDVSNAPPYGVQGAITYKARPYEVSFAIDLVAGNLSKDSSIFLVVSASVDGEKDPIEVFRHEIKASTADTATETNHDFSNSQAFPATFTAPVNESPAQHEKIEELADLPQDATFSHIDSFPIVEKESEKNKAWPEEVAWSDDGSLWVVDSQRRKVLNFSSQGKLKLSFGGKGSGSGLMGLPVSLIVHDGKIYVSDQAQHCLHKFSEDGTFLKSLKSDPTKGALINLPGGLCIRGKELWVADRGLSRISCFDQEGAYLGGFGGKSSAVNSPLGVRADSNGLIVLEKNGIIKKFTPMGQQIAGFQTGCLEARGFDVDPWDSIWICDEAKFQVVRFNLKGKILAILKAPPGPRPWIPTGVTVRQDGMIAVTDAQNKQIHFFKVER